MANLFHNPKWLDVAPADGVPDEYELWNPARMTFNLGADDLSPGGGNKIIVEADVGDGLNCGLKSPIEEGGGENWLDVAHHTFYDMDFYFDLIHGHFTFSFELYHNAVYLTYYTAYFMDNTRYWWVWEDFYSGVHATYKTCTSGHFTQRFYTQDRHWENIHGYVNKLVAIWYADVDYETSVGEDSHFEAAYPVLTIVADEDSAFVT